MEGDDATFHLNFRVKRKTFDHILEKLTERGYLLGNTCRNEDRRITARFKLAVVLYFLAGHGKGDVKVVADVASIGVSTARKYIDEFTEGTIQVQSSTHIHAIDSSF